MIELTLQELVDAGPAIDKVIHCEGLPVKVAYRFSKLVKQIAAEMKELHDSQTKLYLDHQGVPTETENGKTFYKFTPENGKAVQEEMQELLNETVKLEFTPVKLDELGKLTDILTPYDYGLLDKFVVE